MRYFYRCAICKSGFWYDTTIHDNNIECLHCGSSGHEEVFDEEMGKVVPKLHRIQIQTNEQGGIEMPSYSFECRKCNHKFGVYVGMRDLEICRCPKCKAKHEHLDQIYGVPYIISDVSHQEGRTGHEDLDMTHVFGPGARISSRRQLKQYKDLTRDKYFRDTDGKREVMKPFKDPDTGKIHMEKVTREQNGIDLGEIHEVDETTVNKHAGEKIEKEWQETEKIAAAQVEVPK
jgi:putative FmdB family regulatory protein